MFKNKNIEKEQKYLDYLDNQIQIAEEKRDEILASNDVKDTDESANMNPYFNDIVRINAYINDMKSARSMFKTIFKID